MMRTLLLASCFTLLAAHAASATPTSTAPTSAPAIAHVKNAAHIARAPKKGKKPVEKPAEKPIAAPEGARADPRASAPPPAAESTAAAEPGARRGMSRIEFDDRLVQGQTNKANAIYLFERRESALRSLLKKRTDFHEEIDETLE